MGLFEKLQARMSYLASPSYLTPALPLHSTYSAAFQDSQLTNSYLGLELYRLEQRYTRRDKRTTFISEAQYVDAEYVYATSPTPSSAKSSSTNSSANSRRFSKMPAIRIKELGCMGTERS